MTKYLFSRLGRGIISIVLVVMIVMLLIYSLMDKTQIFATDPVYSKQKSNNKVVYQYQQWEKYGYLDYVPYTDWLQEQLNSCIQALERIKGANAPAPAPVAAPKAEPVAFDSDAVADEISQNLEALVGTTVDTAPKATPKHPTANESTTSKFASLNLQFGRNYDPKSK